MNRYDAKLLADIERDERVRDAAPNLLEALKAARRKMDTVAGYSAMVIDQIDAAIAKAEEKS